MIVDVVIPVLNEEKSISRVIEEIPRSDVRHIIVCDNGSTDGTAARALASGAIVVSAPVRGYGSACLKGLAYIAEGTPPPDAVAFMDGDYSDYPEELSDMIRLMTDQNVDLVLGARNLRKREKGSLTPQQVFGNWLATRLIRWLYGVAFHDLGPFRLIRYDALLMLQMRDTNYGWTVEMQAKAAKLGLECREIPVRYRKRIGTSKVSGTVKGSILAGYKIVWTIFSLR